KETKRLIQPAAVYTTLTRQIAEKTTTVQFLDKAIAVSVIAVSIGPGIELERASASEASRQALLSALQQEALGQAQQFVVRLVGEQAKEEDCTMTPLASDASLVPALVALLGAGRIGVDSNGSSLAPHARVAWLFWVAEKVAV